MSNTNLRLNVLSDFIDRNCLLVEAPGWKAIQAGGKNYNIVRFGSIDF